tara:strand:- start:457 stop:1272 length:816 start_codon:yes stop_codon:yes gene_type:complete
MKLLKKIKKILLTLFSKKNTKFKAFDTYQNATAGGKNYKNHKLIKVVIAKSIKYRESLKNNKTLDLMSLRSFFALSLLPDSPQINVLDFGGGAGNHYYLARKLIDDNVKINWHVVETDSFVEEINKQGLQSSELKFFTSIDSAAKSIERFNLIYANSSLQYTNNPLNFLEKLLKVNSDFIFFTRTPLIEDNRKEVIALQISKLSSNGQGEIPPELNLKDEIVEYPFIVVNKIDLENLINQYAEIEYIIEEESSAYSTEKGMFRNFGYIIKK